MTQKEKIKASLLSILLNFLLFVIKIIAGLVSGSLALISDAINSFTDIISSAAILFAVKVSVKKADSGHPFGYRRVEPLAGFIVAIFTGIFGFEIAKSAFMNIIQPRLPEISLFTVSVPVISILVKWFMTWYYSTKAKDINSPALKAIAVDARNDIFVSFVVLTSIIGALMHIKYLDSIAALIISMFIFHAGYKLGIENANFLLGRAPPQSEVESIQDLVRQIKGVRGINDVRAHYVGNFIHIEIHIEVSKSLNTLQGHRIGKAVQRTVEKLSYVDKAFIHIDPVDRRGIKVY